MRDESHLDAKDGGSRAVDIGDALFLGFDVLEQLQDRLYWGA